MDMRRSEMTRGPYMDPDTYDRIKELADKRDDMNIEDTLDKLIKATVNEDGNITVGPVKMKFDS